MLKKTSLSCGVSEVSIVAIGFHSHRLGANNEYHDHDCSIIHFLQNFSISEITLTA